MILDLTMPGLDGAEVLRSIRAINPATRALVMSGYSKEDILARLRGLGEVAILRKPFTQEILLNALRALPEAARRLMSTPPPEPDDPYAALRIPNYHDYVIGSFLLLWLVVRQFPPSPSGRSINGHSSTALGLVGLANVLPLLALSLPAGALNGRPL